jgi:glyceraldehyde-3-phosphate dehydrogenase (NAD(P))
MKGILAYSDLPLVSIDYRKTDESSIVDSSLTMVMGGDMVKGCRLVRQRVGLQPTGS